MGLLERVSALIRANLNHLIEKAEDPEKMLKQVILDMENQMMQVKTQVAIAIADQHLLERRRIEQDEKHAEWLRKAELAVSRGDDELARAAIERSMTAQQNAVNFAQQVEDQHSQVETLKGALRKLEAKLEEARTKCDLLIAKNRRSRAMKKAGEAQTAFRENSSVATFDRMERKVMHEEAVADAHAEMAHDDVDARFAAMEKGDRVDELLAELKSKKAEAATR